MTTLRASLIEPGDPRWALVLGSGPYDFYHLPAYAQLTAREDGAEAAALLVTEGERQMLLPLTLRQIPDGGVDAASPYGYPGPLTVPRGDDEFLARALRVGTDLLRERGYVSLFVRLHPLLQPSVPPGIGTLVEHPPTVAIDLGLADEEWRTTIRRSHRQQIDRALEAGHHAWMDAEWRHLERFKQLYHQTMERLGASPSYRFSDAYFDELRTALGDSLNLCVLERDGRVWAAGLFVETAGIVESHLSADDGSFRRGGAKKLLYAFVRDWARDRGDRWFHLGGGGPAGKGLLGFKAGFASERLPFRTLRVVLRPAEYRHLVAEHGAVADALDPGGFFPAYRDR